MQYLILSILSDLSQSQSSSAAVKSPPKARITPPGIYADLDNPSLPDEKLKKFSNYIGDIYTKLDKIDTNKVNFNFLSMNYFANGLFSVKL